MAELTAEQFLLSCINNSDLTKIDYAKVATGCGITSTGAAGKRYSRWKTKTEKEMAKGPDAAGEGAGDDEPNEGSASPKKAKKTPAKRAATAEGKEGTPKTTPAKKTPVKKTPAKNRKLEEDAEEGANDAVRDEPMEGGKDES